MKQLSKLKIILGLIYLLIVALVTILFFYYEAYNYVNSDFIKNDRKVIINYINQNIFLHSLLFFLFCTIWFFLLGFGIPVVVLAGFIFGSVLGSLLLLMGFVFGSTALYVFANHYFKDLVFKYFLNKYKSLDSHFKKNDFAYLLFLRLVPGIPSQVGSLIPILFNMKLKKIFLSNIFGVAPGICISVSLVSGISSKIEEGYSFNLDLLSDPKVSIPLTALGIMVLIVNFVKQKFFKSKI
ncbi:MAG: TVP38/TMEM64 family protein [Candidatus Fonsibacter sp.]|nr:TVP38/TMEM64 family protein [Candidatus Fonsibacter sp.]